jgi:hypothetical protein
MLDYRLGRRSKTCSTVPLASFDLVILGNRVIDSTPPADIAFALQKPDLYLDYTFNALGDNYPSVPVPTH